MIEKNFIIKFTINESNYNDYLNKQNAKTDEEFANNLYRVLKSRQNPNELSIVNLVSVKPLVKPILIFDEAANYFSKTKKVILNKCYGGFDLSDDAVALYANKKRLDFDDCKLLLDSSYREDPTLIEIVEELGPKASGRYGKLKVVEIPADMEYVIDDYDGIETLHKKVQEW